MAWTVDTFLARYPQFAEVIGARDPDVDGTVQRCLTDAALCVDSDVWGDKADLGTGLYAAHLLSLLPFWDGKVASWVTKTLRTPYLEQFEAWARRVGTAHRIVLHEDEVT